MAPIKFEENIKEKLDKRHINPSAKAWEKVEAGLDNSQRGKKINYRWITIAAVFIGVVILAINFIDKPQDQNSQRELVETEVELPTKSIDQQPARESTKKTIKEPAKKGVALSGEKETVQKPSIPSPQAKEKKPQLSEKVVTVDANTVKTKNLDQETLFEQTIDKKVQELMAQVSIKKQNTQDISEDEIDALLTAAQRDIIRERIFNDQTQAVDANALLQDVEMELDHSFRDKIFEALKESFNKAREAVASRNN